MDITTASFDTLLLLKDLTGVVLEGACLLLLVLLILIDDVHGRFEGWVEHLLLLSIHFTH